MKRIFQHLEAQHITAFFAFVALGFALKKDHGVCIAVVFSLLGLALAVSAARNSYVAKSTMLVDKYDERFNEKMVRERKSAALYLLGENPNADELEDVLDFFETPIAAKVEAGCVDAGQVHETFYHWIRLYYQTSKKFIEEYRKEEPAAYDHLAELYVQTSECERKAIEKAEGRRCKLEDLLLSQEEVTKYLRQEANLKTDSADWEKIFRKEH